MKAALPQDFLHSKRDTQAPSRLTCCRIGNSSGPRQCICRVWLNSDCCTGFTKERSRLDCALQGRVHNLWCSHASNAAKHFPYRLVGGDPSLLRYSQAIWLLSVKPTTKDTSALDTGNPYGKRLSRETVTNAGNVDLESTLRVTTKDTAQTYEIAPWMILRRFVKDATGSITKNKWIRGAREEDFASQWTLLCAFVAQDGQEDLSIPWDRMAALFVGGSTDWKMSNHASTCIKAAKAIGKWVHVGRVNTPGRFEHFDKLGADSIDGSGLARYSWMRQAIYKEYREPHLFPVSNPDYSPL